MFLGSFLSLRLREAALETALRDELKAHAVRLSIALEENYAVGRATRGVSPTVCAKIRIFTPC